MSKVNCLLCLLQNAGQICDIDIESQTVELIVVFSTERWPGERGPDGGSTELWWIDTNR